MTTSRIRDISWASADPDRLPKPRDTGALRYTALRPKDIDADSVHHTTGAGLPASSTIAQEIAYLKAIDTGHRARGLDAIGYQLVPFASGRVYVTAPLDRYGAAVALQNSHTISIALPGDFTTKPPSAAHLHAAAHAIAHVDAYLKRNVPVRGHRYWGRTACPGSTQAAWVPGLRAAALSLHARYYTTIAGDTAHGIARKNGITFATLASLNPAGPPSHDWALIHAGERYRVA